MDIAFARGKKIKFVDMLNFCRNHELIVNGNISWGLVEGGV